jgi:hypothetical protein
LADKSISVTSGMTGSRNSTLLKTVNTIIQSHKKVNEVYVFLLGLAIFASAYIILFEYISGELAMFNKSNLNNFRVSQLYLMLDRGLLESLESLDEMLMLKETFSNITEYQETMSNFTKAAPGLDPWQHLSIRLNNTLNDISNANSEIHYMTTEVIDAEDAIDITELAFLPKRFTYTSRQMDVDSSPIIDEYIAKYSIILYYMQEMKSVWTTLAEVKASFDSTYPVLSLSQKQEEDAFEATTSLNDIDESIYTHLLSDMRLSFTQITKSMVFDDIPKHFDPIWIELYIAMAFGTLFIAYLAVILFQISAKMRHILENYLVLKNYEITSIIETLQDEKETFTRFAFHELYLANKYLEFNLIQFTLSMNERNSYNQAKAKATSSSIKPKSRIHQDFLFYSLKAIVCVGLITSIIFGLTVITVVSFSEVNKRRMGMQKVYYEMHGRLTTVTIDYYSLFAISIYGNHMEVANAYPMENAYKNAFNDFASFVNSITPDLEFYYSKADAHVIKDILTGSMCDYWNHTDQSKFQQFDVQSYCKNANHKAAQKGLLGYLHGYSDYSNYLRLSIPSLPPAHPPIPPMQRIFHDSEYIEQRLGYWIAMQIFYDTVSAITLSTTDSIKTTLNIYFSGLVYYSTLGLSLLFILCVLYAGYSLHTDLQYTYALYTLIDPFYLMNNKLLQSQLQSAFHGIS